MRTIPRRFRRDIIALTLDEIDAVDWSTVSRGCIYLDLWGTVHLELHHAGHLPWFHNTSWRLLLWRQEQLYAELPAKLFRASRSQDPHDLIGARQFIYLRKHRMLMPANVGILSWDAMCQRGDPARNPAVSTVRRAAFATLFSALDVVAECLQANFAFMPTATIADNKMRAYGCIPHSLKTWQERFVKWCMTFPVRNQRVYIKLYRNIQ